MSNPLLRKSARIEQACEDASAKCAARCATHGSHPQTTGSLNNLTELYAKPWPLWGSRTAFEARGSCLHTLGFACTQNNSAV